MKNSLLILLILFICVSFLFIGYNFGISKIGSFKDLIESSEEHNSPPPVVIEPGSAVETASYIIFHDDEGFVYAKNGDTGKIEFSGTDASDVINDVLANGLTPGRTWKETVVLKGDFILDSTIFLPSYCRIDAYQAKITLAPNCNCDFFQPADLINSNGAIEIWGGKWYGDYNNQASGYFINWVTATQGSFDSEGEATPFMWLKDLFVQEIKDGYFVNTGGTAGNLWVHGCKFDSTAGIGFDLDVLGDSWFDNNQIIAHKEMFKATQLISTMITNNYFGGTSGSATAVAGVYLIRPRQVWWSNNVIDNVYKHGIVVEGYEDMSLGWGQQNTFVGGSVRGMHKDATNNTYSAFRLVDARYNTIQGMTLGDGFYHTEKQFKYGIEELGQSDYNTIVGVVAYDIGTEEFLIVGANTEKTACIGD